jgi:TATA-binding protein-associated factor
MLFQKVDLQAMDRAHRLGQKRMVNVYRLITRRTLEEQIMSLQHFKLRMTQAVVNEENAAMATMDTSALFDLANSMQTQQPQDEQENDEAELARYKEMTKYLQ